MGFPRLTRRQRNWYVLFQQLRNIKLRQSSSTVITTYPLKIGLFGDSTAAAGSTNTSSVNYITSITKANPGVVTKVNHGFTSGDLVYHWGIQGMTEVNQQEYTVTVINANSYSIGVDTTNFSPYVANTWSGGYSYRRKNAVMQKNSQGPISGLNMLLGQRFDFHHSYNRGIGGNSSANCVTRMVNDLPASLGVNIWDVKISTNDFHAGLLAVDVYNRVLQIVDYITNTLGGYCSLRNAPPYTGDATANKDQRELYNAMIAAYTAPKLIKHDVYSVLVDPATRDYKALMSYDGVHLAPYGQFAEDALVAYNISDVFGYGPGFVLNPGNLLLNPNFSGTAGFNSTPGSITSNGIADSWTSDQSGTVGASQRLMSKNGAGNQVMNVNFGTGLTSDERLSIRQDVLAANLTVGARYVAELEYTIDNFSGIGIWYQADLELRNQSTAFAYDLARRNTDPLNVAGMISANSSRNLHLKTLPVGVHQKVWETYAASWIISGSFTDFIGLKSGYIFRKVSSHSLFKTFVRT